jgi:tetratricopeptide (TPR) repeat protein
MVILWAAYFFRYSESATGVESFNRPLAEKIKDVRSPCYQMVLGAMNATHVVPRAYLWGFADTVLTGLEGREFAQLFLGRVYYTKAPKYFFPVVMAVKLPIGLLALSLLGLLLFIARRTPSEWNLPGGVILGAAALFLLILSMGATYAGIRHALPVVILLSVFAGITCAVALSAKTPQLKIAVALAFVAAAVSALPQTRPWEYFNEFVGGTSNAYKYFVDEGVDLGQRTKEMAGFYTRELRPAHARPDCLYFYSEEEMYARGIDCFGSDKVHDRALEALPERSGTIFAGPHYLLRMSYWDRPALREARPTTRFGNLLVFQGSFYMPGSAAAALYFQGLDATFGEKPDDVEAEKAFRRSVELDPSAYFVHVQLGNLYLKRGSREESVHAYSDALKYAPNEPQFRSALQNQIQRVSRDPLTGVTPLRDPYME